ncbi:MAG: DUF4129 domain-containing protein [Pseudomonadota bacterium]
MLAAPIRMPLRAALTLLLIPLGAVAQEPPVIVPLEVERTQSGQDYLDSLRFTRIDGDIVYVDQLEGKITVDTRLPEPPAQDDPPTGSALNMGNAPNVWGVILLLGLLVGALFLVRKYGGGLRARFAKDDGGEIPVLHVPEPGALPRPSKATLFDELRAMGDRRAALVLLLRHVLAAAAHSNKLRHIDSETARELLRRLPAAWPRRDQLRQIIMAEELVQFGGRDLAEETFEACLDLAKPILAESPA